MNKIETTFDENLSIAPKRLANWLAGEREVTLLDVRPTGERQEWSIPESIHADIYQELKTGHSKTLESMDLPDDRPVVTICGAGKTSLTAARQLREKGLDAYSLEGGMKSWNFAWDAAEFAPTDDLEIIQVRRMAKGCLSYIVGSGDEAVVIDASLDPEAYLDLAEERGWNIRYVADTHLHADFVSRTRELAEAAGTDYLLYREAETGFPFVPVENGQAIDFGSRSLKVLHTPGHTPESLSFLVEGEALFSGDTLFTDGVGRPDLKADEARAKRKAARLYESLHRLLELDDPIRVFPAHIAGSIRYGAPVISSTIGELSDTLELLSLPKKEFVRHTVSRIPPTPSNYETISKINKTGRREGHLLEELEAGANRCAAG